MARSTTTEAVVLRSFRLGEADRILHVYTHDRGRVGAVAKGVRKTKSRFGARLEPFSHVELVLHQGRGELETVTGASLVRSHDRIRTDPYRLQVGMIGLEAMLRLFTEQEANEKAFTALTRFLDALDDVPPRPGLARRARSRRALVPAQAALGVRATRRISRRASSAGRPIRSSAFSPRRAEAPAPPATPVGSRSRPRASTGCACSCTRRSPPRRRRASATGRSVTHFAVVNASYEHHGGFRLKTLLA